MGSIRSKPWIVETLKASKFTIVGRCSLDQDDMYTNLKRYHQRTII